MVKVPQLLKIVLCHRGITGLIRELIFHTFDEAIEWWGGQTGCEMMQSFDISLQISTAIHMSIQTMCSPRLQITGCRQIL